MNDPQTIWRVLLLVVAVAGAGVAIFFYYRTLRDIERSNLPPDERRKWKRRVIFLRGIGWAQWEQYRRKHNVRLRTTEPEDEGLDDAPPPGAD